MIGLSPTRPSRQGAEPRLVLNNGATGMPNFRGDRAGLLTRVALAAFDGGERRFGLLVAGGRVHVDAIGVDFDADAWQAICKDGVRVRAVTDEGICADHRGVAMWTNKPRAARMAEEAAK